MSFRFKTLHLKNWLVYGGTTELSFSPLKKGRNIVTIHGQNGFGKTSLLRALEFLFHDRYDREEYLELWHDRDREANDGQQGKVEVALELDYQDTPLKLIREIEVRPHGSTRAITSTLTLINVETGEPEDQAQDKVELMIPEKSQQFVLFDGAEITRYAKRQHEDGVRDAIERMLGIPAVRNLGDDLEKLISDLEDKQSEIAILEEGSQDLVQEIDNLQNKLDTYQSQQESKEEKLQSLERMAQELERETAEIAAIKTQQNQLDEKRRRLADYEDRRKEKTKQIDNILRSAPLHLLEGPLTQIVQEGQARQQNGQSSRRGAYRQQKQFLESIVADDECVCGRPVTENVEARIQTEIKRLADLSAQMSDSESEDVFTFAEVSSLAGTLERLRDRSVDGEDLFDRRSAIDDKIEEIETDIRRLTRELEGHESANVRENMRLQRRYGERVNDLRNEIDNLKQNIARVEKEITDKQRELDEVTTGTGEGQRVTIALQEARKLHAAVDDFVDRLVAEKREAIEESSTEIFQGITNKPQEYAGVRVKGDYTLEVYRHDGTTVENAKLSAGEKEVLAYSFITALNLSSPNPAPFVMDTPFGHLDSDHRDRLLQSLPRLDVQVFLLATDRDLPEQERDSIAHFIADEFVIRRDQEEARSYIEAR